MELNIMPDQLLYFDQTDRDNLGTIAETMRGFIHTRPCTRGDFDTCQTLIKGLAPTLDPDLTEPLHETHVDDFRVDLV